jgi:hypothetical protein
LEYGAGGINNYNPKRNTMHNNINNMNNNINLNKQMNPNINAKNKPLNNFDPNLMRKSRTPNILNRPGSSNSGPVKIQNIINKNNINKPTTPDYMGMNHFLGNRLNVGMNNNTNNKLNNIYTNNSYSIIHRTNSKNKNGNNVGLKRPSTAPQKDKTSKGKINNPNIYSGGYYMGPTKRLPSPMIQSHNTSKNNFYKTQKLHPERYRAPSPLIKSSTLSLDPLKRTKIY